MIQKAREGFFALNQLRQKEVINVCEGRSLGCVCDLIFDECKGHIHAIVVPGNSGFCGLFGRQNFVIPGRTSAKSGTT